MLKELRSIAVKKQNIVVKRIKLTSKLTSAGSWRVAPKVFRTGPQLGSSQQSASSQSKDVGCSSPVSYTKS